MLDQLNGLPDIINVGRVDDNVAYVGHQNYTPTLCVFGLDFSSGFTVNLYRPDGSQLDPVSYSSPYFPIMMATGLSYPIEGPSETIPQTGYTLGSDIPVIELQMWWPAGIPKGGMVYRNYHTGCKWLECTFYRDFPGRTPVVQYNRPPVWQFPKAHLLGFKRTIHQTVRLLGIKMGLKRLAIPFTSMAQILPLARSPHLAFTLRTRLIETGGAVLLRQINGTANQRGDWIASTPSKPVIRPVLPFSLR